MNRLQATCLIHDFVRDHRVTFRKEVYVTPTESPILLRESPETSKNQTIESLLAIGVRRAHDLSERG